MSHLLQHILHLIPCEYYSVLEFICYHYRCFTRLIVQVVIVKSPLSLFDIYSEDRKRSEDANVNLCEMHLTLMLFNKRILM